MTVLPTIGQSAPDPHLRDSARRAVRGAGPVLVAGERVLLLAVPLPVKGHTRRQAALAFAIEERLPLPLERMHVALAQGRAEPALAAAMTLEAMSHVIAQAPDRSLVPEPLAIPRPAPDAAGPAWALWCAGGRVVVRVSDGTGFALPLDALPDAWALAGRPILDLYGDAPADLPARVRGTLPPTPAAEDLAFDLRQGHFAPAGAGWRAPLRAAAITLGLGLAGHLVIAAIDARALSALSVSERAKAAVAVAAALPGAPLDAGPAALMSRLAPSPARAPEGSAFLPLLGAVSGAMTEDATLRRITWSSGDRALRLRLQASGLDALQRIEAQLRDAGLSVESGVATAQQGGAEVEMQVSGP